MTSNADSGPYFKNDFSSDTNKSIDLDELKGPPNGQSGWVIIEPMNVLPSDSPDKINLIPYKYRRKKWGQSVSLAYSMFYPSSMESHVGTFAFNDIYSSDADTPMTEFQFNIKRNMTIGSIAIEFGLGFYSNKADTDLVDSNLEIIPARIGLNYTADSFFDIPYIAPYLGGGGYIFKYTESQGTTAFNGTTQLSTYITVGANFSLDWIDKKTSAIAYIEGGIESTSLFIEARKYMASGAEADPNFETDFDGQAGLRLEF